MNDFPFLTLMVVVPLLGAVATAALPAGHKVVLPKQVALGTSLLTLLLGVVMAFGYDRNGGFQFTEQHTWIKAFGASYALGVDGLGLLMVLLTAVLIPIVIGASWYDADPGATLRLDDEAAATRHTKAFFAWALALEALSIAVFAATDVFLFYVVFEATLIPAYFLVGGFGGNQRRRAAVKFLVYQLAGGLVMLASVIGLYVVSAAHGTPSYLFGDLQGISIDPDTQKWLFIGFFVAFAIKAPLFPVHTWLPDTTEQATTGTSVLLVCILDKIGAYGMLRFCLGLLPDGSQWATPVVITLALISIVYGALVAIGQDDMLRLFGYMSVSHFGFIVLGIFVLTTQGGSGAVLYMVNHGLATAALFLVAGFLIKRRGTASIRAMGGVEKAAPVLAGLFLVFGLAALSLPGLSPFVSEILVIIAAFQHHWWTGAIAVSAIVLTAFYILWMYQRTMTGPELVGGRAAETTDLDRREVGTLAPLFLALVLFGFFPMPLLNVINPYVHDTLQHVGVTDPAPTVSDGTIGTAQGGQP
ncbi:MAG TPA: NADH-quinone oxidoreductase subunit M [Nocardioides sp.]|nr:NADH-quinone oxidoreductase subunit M [Nocardioides sp.]